MKKILITLAFLFTTTYFFSGSGPTYDTINPTSCGIYTSPAGNNYSASSMFNDTLSNSTGFDSIITVNLTVTNLTADSVSMDSWCDGSTQITVHNSAIGVTYSVIDTSTGNRFTGVTDQTGTGSNLFFGVWLTQDTVLEVIATKNGCTLSLGYLEGKYIPSQPGVFIDTTVCGTYISPKGRIITTDSLFEDTITIGSNCYYIIPITVTFSGPSYDTLNVSSCGSYTSPSGNVYTSSATYNDTITKSNNCDSIITINLTITNPTSSSISLSSCSNYNSPSGKTLSVSGIYKDTIVNSYGCDSLITISFTKLSGSSSSMTVTACDSYTAPSGKIFISSGTVKDTIANTAGCDSIITINLTINASSTSSISVSSCMTYSSPSGKTLSTTGVYKDTILNSLGCDSIITINFTKLNSTSSSITLTACDSYTAPSGTVFTSSGTVKDTIASTAGCDSIITIILTINSVSTGTSVSGITLSANLGGATYQWLDCDNGYSPISGEISQTYTPTANGNYAVEITTSSCTDTSTCQSINSVGIKKTDKTQLLVYPNPVINSLTVKGVELSKSTWMVTTINGQQLTLQSYRNTINTESLASGTYMLRIETTDGIYFRKFIKR